jgi:malate synthase
MDAVGEELTMAERAEITGPTDRKMTVSALNSGANVWLGKTPCGITGAGLRNNISVALRYLASWLGGDGAVAIEYLMEDTATAEISRSQVWQWIHNEVVLDDGPLVTRDVVERMIDEELVKIRDATGESFDAARYGQAVALFTEVALADAYPTFLTLPAYERMP